MHGAMRRRLAVLIGSLFGLTLVAACLAPGADDGAESSADELRRRGVEVPAPRPARDAGAPDTGTRRPILVGPIATVVAPSTQWCGTTRFDLRRLTRTCEDLPGAVVEAGVTYVPGASGRFAVERPLAGTSAPASLQDKTCAFTWEPVGCAPPDTSVLLVEEPADGGAREQLVPRAPGCHYLPGGCNISTPPPKVDGGNPTGLGRCEVCGFAANDHLWAVLPADWKSFSYWAGDQRRFVQLSAPQDFYEADLGTSVQAQDVTLYKYDSAPETRP